MEDELRLQPSFKGSAYSVRQKLEMTRTSGPPAPLNCTLERGFAMSEIVRSAVILLMGVTVIAAGLIVVFAA